MPKIRTMSAGRAGATAYNTNVNANTGGGNKKQGLTTTTNKSVQFVSNAIKNRAYGENRDFVFCVNQLGGIGGKSKMFATTADGVKDCITGPYGCEQIVREAYLEALNREPDQGGLRTYCLAMKKRGFTKNDVIADILQSDEAQNIYKTTYVITYVVEEINLSELGDDDKQELKNTIKNTYASIHNIDPSNVSVILSEANSIAVEVTVKLPTEEEFIPSIQTVSKNILTNLSPLKRASNASLSIKNNGNSITAATPIESSVQNSLLLGSFIPQEVTFDSSVITVERGTPLDLVNLLRSQRLGSGESIEILENSATIVSGLKNGTLDIDSYNVGVRVRNSLGQTKEFMLPVTVKDTKPPVFESTTVKSVPETKTTGFSLATIKAQDPSPVTYSLVGGNNKFEINSSTGELTLSSGVDYEEQQQYHLTIKATDNAGNVTNKSITVNIQNEAPVLSNGVLQNDDDTSLKSDNVDSKFYTNKNVKYTFTSSEYENVKVYVDDEEQTNNLTNTNGNFTIEFVGETDGLKPERKLTVKDALEAESNSLSIPSYTIDRTAPTFAGLSTFNVAENQTTVGTVQATDPQGASLNYQIVGNNGDNDKFSIDPSTGALTFKTAPDYDIPGSVANSNTYTVTVTVSDVSGNASSQDITVNVLDVDDDPPNITSSPIFNVAENQTVIGQVIATDPQGASLYYQIGGSEIQIDSNGVLKFYVAPDYENPGSAANSNTYTATVTVSDVSGNASSQHITVNVLDVKSVNVFGETVKLTQVAHPTTAEPNPTYKGFLSDDFDLTFDLTDIWYHDPPSGVPATATWSGNDDGYSGTNPPTGTTARNFKDALSLPENTQNYQVEAAVLSGIMTAYTTGDYSGNTFSPNTSLDNITLPYIDPEHYLLEINLPSTTKPKKYNRTNQTSYDVDDVDDVEWRLSYCSTPGDSSTIIHTFISGTQTTLQNGYIRLDVATDVTNAGKDAQTSGKVWYPIPSASNGQTVGYVTGNVLIDETNYTSFTVSDA